MVGRRLVSEKEWLHLQSEVSLAVSPDCVDGPVWVVLCGWSCVGGPVWAVVACNEVKVIRYTT